MAASYWHQPYRWQRQATAADARPVVFCASPADVFDNAAPAGQRERLRQVIRQTPALEWPADLRCQEAPTDDRSPVTALQ